MADERGVVHIDVPIDRPHQHVEVVVVWVDAAETGDRDSEEVGMALLQPGDLTGEPDPTV